MSTTISITSTADGYVTKAADLPPAPEDTTDDTEENK